MTKHQRLCLKGLKKKEGEDSVYTALAATTHPDRVGDILSLNAIEQITQFINTDSSVGGEDGAYRSVSLFHDWIQESNPALDEAAFIVPNSAKTVELDNGHYGTEVDLTINQYYKGDMKPEEIDYRIQNGAIGGLSIEYGEGDTRNVSHNGKEYNFVETLSEFGGVGLARSRMIANPHAVIYKEIENKINKHKEDNKMAEDDRLKELEAKEKELQAKEEALKVKEEELKKAEEEPAPEPEKKEEPEVKEKSFNIKEFMKTDEYKGMVDNITENIKVKSKIVKTKEDDKMNTGINLNIKEMNEALKAKEGKMDTMLFKEHARKVWSTKEYNDSLREAYNGHGIILKGTDYPVLSYKEVGNHSCKDIASHRLRLPALAVKEMSTKDTLDTTSNTTTYTQAPVEFADFYVPGLLETFNTRTDLFDALPKIDNVMGGIDYLWKIKASQKSSLSVQRDDPTVSKTFADKVNLKTPIKVYRQGISVSDFTLHHSRAAMGDLFSIEANIAMSDLRKDLNKDLYKEVADGDGDTLLGLEAVADSTGNTTLYGLTRTVAKRLKTTALASTYQDVSGALTTAYMRSALTAVEVAGAEKGNMLIVTSPYIRDALFELLDGQQQLFVNPDFGFSGAIRFDGTPVLVDSDCPSTASERQLYVIDLMSDKIVMSKMPQLTGLAKVSAATEAYVEVYLAHVYDRPTYIHMLDNLT